MVVNGAEPGHCLLPGVLKMGTHLAGIICLVVSIFATNVSITTTEGNVDMFNTSHYIKPVFYSYDTQAPDRTRL